MPNPVEGLPSLAPCPQCYGKAKVVFEIIGREAIGVISCTKCGYSTKRRVWIEAKRLWNSRSKSLDETVVE